MPRGKISGLVGTIAVAFMFSAIKLGAQDFNPPFPRTMFQRPGGLAGGAVQHFFAKYDLAIHGGGLSNAAAANDSIRALNPNIVIFGTSRQGVWPGSFPPGCFVYREAFATLTRAAQPGESEIMVSNTTGFLPTADDNFLLLGSDDWVTITGKTDTSFIGIPVSEDWAINYTHPVGDSVKTIVRFVGFGMLHNITPLAPLVSGKEAWRYFIDQRYDPTDRQDFSSFDGAFYDAFRFFFWGDDITGGVDLDYNHINDFQEHGLDWFNGQWQSGIESMLPYEHEKLLSINPDIPAYVTTNMGSAQDGYALDYCEGMMWEGFMRYAYSWEEMLRINRLWEQRHQPVFTMIEDYDSENRREYAKNKFNYMRYGLTTALMAGAYYGRTFGDSYYISLYYDEFDTDLGYPTSDPQELASGAYVRFFDNGAAICNPTGSYVTVTAGELAGLSGYQGPYYRFLGGQKPDFNNGQIFTSVDLYGTNEDPSQPKKIKGDGILLFTHPDTVVSDITVGNCFNNDTSPGSNPVELSGWWGAKKDLAGPDASMSGRNPCYSQWTDDSEDGIGYAYTDPGDGTITATYRPTIGVPGYYEISEWHGWVGTSPEAYLEATNVPFEVVVSGSRQIAGVINQAIRAGRWNKIAVIYLPVGSNSYVRINNKTDHYVIADAMRFRFLGQSKTDSVPPRKAENLQFQRN